MENKIPNREKRIEIMAKSYYKLLTSDVLKDEYIFKGLEEGLGKFLSNLQIFKLFKDAKGKGVHKKYIIVDYMSKNAWDKIKKKEGKGLIFEHIVPKQKYKQGLCLEKAKKGKLTEKFVYDLLDRYWYIATVTREEDKNLVKEMPDDWDGKNIFARYEQMINEDKLIVNPYLDDLGLKEDKEDLQKILKDFKITLK